jgi:lipopolysaccharide cholinephosphotransferase
VKLSKENVDDMNNIQLEILKEFLYVCNSLNLSYYMVHGSLLGAVRFENFFPFDDDIDIAMPRKDYDRFISMGQDYLPNHLFIQSYKSEKQYPFPFAKIRNSNTSFVQTDMRKLDINEGIYIDIFPIDNYPTSRIKQCLLSLLELIYRIRISLKIYYPNKQPLWKEIIRICSVIACPSWDVAVRKRANLYTRIPQSGNVITIGGKVSEKGIPKNWLGEGELLPFAGIKVRCPKHFKEYLSVIYGNFETYNPAEKYMNHDGTVTVSAEIFSTSESYELLRVRERQ